MNIVPVKYHPTCNCPSSTAINSKSALKKQTKTKNLVIMNLGKIMATRSKKLGNIVYRERDKGVKPLPVQLHVRNVDSEGNIYVMTSTAEGHLVAERTPAGKRGGDTNGWFNIVGKLICYMCIYWVQLAIKTYCQHVS